MGEDFAEKANRSKPKYPYIDDLRAEAQERESEYKSIKTNTVHSGLLSPKASALAAQRINLPSKTDNPGKTSFKINKRPQSATVKARKDVGQSNTEINVIEEAITNKPHKRGGADAVENLLLKTKVVLGGESFRVAIMHDMDKEGLVFYIYSRRANFAQKIEVDMETFKEIQSQANIGVESTLERMTNRLKGNMDDGIAFV